MSLPRHALALALLALAAPASAQPREGSACGAGQVIPLPPSTTVRGRTDAQPDRAHASCARQALSGDRVYALHLEQSSRVSLRVAADYDVAIYLRRECDDEVSEVACNDDLEDSFHAGLDVELAAGTWYVFVDGYDTDSAGRFTLTVNSTPLGPRLSRVPARPPVATRAPARPRS